MINQTYQGIEIQVTWNGSHFIVKIFIRFRNVWWGVFFDLNLENVTSFNAGIVKTDYTVKTVESWGPNNIINISFPTVSKYCLEFFLLSAIWICSSELRRQTLNGVSHKRLLYSGWYLEARTQYLLTMYSDLGQSLPISNKLQQLSIFRDLCKLYKSFRFQFDVKNNW